MNDLQNRFSGVSGSRRVSRRALLRFSAGAGLAAAMLPLLAACGGDDDDDDDDDAGTTPTAGTGSTTATTGTGTGSTTPTAGTGGTTATTGTGAGGATVEVALADLTLTADPASASAGEVTFNATNNGAMEHELVVIKSDLAPDALPLTADGTMADESGLEVIGKIQGIPAGETMSDAFELTAGKYVLICNIAGHYPGGMRAAFEVM